VLHGQRNHHGGKLEPFCCNWAYNSTSSPIKASSRVREGTKTNCDGRKGKTA
jgi:hypothetical protein